MKHDEEILNFDSAFVLRLSLFWVFFGSAAFILALLGIFHIWIIAACLAALFCAGIYITLKQKWLFSLSSEFWFAVLFAIVASFLITYPTTPSIFSGRDQGSISEAAILLAQNHKLTSSSEVSKTFFEIYGPGKALNFPGFHYTSSGTLVSQFPLGYISWLAAFFALGGLAGLTIANFVLVAAFILSAYFFARRFLSQTFSALFIIFCVTSFPLVWFSRYTLSENMAVALVSIILLSLVIFLRSPSGAPFLTLLSSLMLLTFVRIEGIFLLITSSIVVMFSPHAKSYLMNKPLRRLVYPAIAFFALFTFNAYRDRAFYIEIAKVLRGIIKENNLLTNTNAATTSITQNLDTIAIWHSYGILGFFVLGIICIIGLFIRGRFFRLVPLFVTLPAFFYLIDAHISSDHPWMLRRYMFAVLPVTAFYATILIAKIFGLKGNSQKARTANISAAIILAILLLVANLRASIPFATYSENSNMLSQIGFISTNFSDKDLVLVDRLATGDAWSMMSGPLRFIYGKNAVYFFNPEDLVKIDYSQYAQVYLIIPDQSLDAYAKISDSFKEVAPYSISTNRLSVRDVEKDNGFKKIEKNYVTTYGKIYVYEPGQ